MTQENTFRMGLLVAAGLSGVLFGNRGTPPNAFGQDREQEVHMGVEADQLSRINLVLEDFSAGPKATSADAQRVHDVVMNDLSMTDFFNILVARPGTALAAPPDTNGWAGMTASNEAMIQLAGGVFPGAQFIAGASVTMSGADLVVEGYLKEYPSFRGVLSRSYRARPEWYREAAHRFSDDIVLYLTGEEGISRTRIAFISSQTGSKELYLVDYDGQNVRQITRDKSIALSPAWNGDASRVAFVSFRRGDPDLYQVSLSSGEITLLAGKPGPDMSPAYSRDGRHLAFTQTVEGNSEIVVSGADGRSPKRITRNKGIDTAPCWAPTGQELCFTSDRSGSPQLYVSDSEGGSLRRLTQTGTWNDSPDWSPDGQKIVYVSRGGSGFKIWTIGADGSGAIALTGGGGSDENPRWAPDGRKIVFSSTREGKRALYTMNADGTGVRRLTFISGDCFGTSWSSRPAR